MAADKTDSKVLLFQRFRVRFIIPETARLGLAGEGFLAVWSASAGQRELWLKASYQKTSGRWNMIAYKAEK